MIEPDRRPSKKAIREARKEAFIVFGVIGTVGIVTIIMLLIK